MREIIFVCVLLLALSSEGAKLKIVSLNTWGLPGLIDYKMAGKLPFKSGRKYYKYWPTQRAIATAENIKANFSGIDILCLQEVFRADSRNVFLDRLTNPKKQGPFKFHYEDNSGPPDFQEYHDNSIFSKLGLKYLLKLLGTNSGLMNFAKKEILNPEIYHYKKFMGEEVMAKKGFSVIQYRLSNDILVTIINTHTQTGGEEFHKKLLTKYFKPEYEGRDTGYVKLDQAREIDEFMKSYHARHPGSAATFLLGDLNLKIDGDGRPKKWMNYVRPGESGPAKYVAVFHEWSKQAGGYRGTYGFKNIKNNTPDVIGSMWDNSYYKAYFKGKKISKIKKKKKKGLTFIPSPDYDLAYHRTSKYFPDHILVKVEKGYSVKGETIIDPSSVPYPLSDHLAIIGSFEIVKK